MDGTILNKKYNLEERVEALEEGGGYELPIASANTLGGIKIGNDLRISNVGKLSVTVTTPAWSAIYLLTRASGNLNINVAKTINGKTTNTVVDQSKIFNFDDVFTVGWNNSVPNWKVTILKDTIQYEKGTVLEIISSGAFDPITIQYDAPPERRDLSEAFNALVARVVALENS